MRGEKPPERVRLLVRLVHPEVRCWNFEPRHAAHLEEAVPGLEVRFTEDEASFLAALPEAEAALVWTFSPEWLERAPRLRLLATPAAGRDYFSVPEREGVELIYGTFHGKIMAETVAGLLLAEWRGILLAERLRAVDPWPRAAIDAQARTVRGSHVVILGFGNIGTHIGRALKCFGARLTGLRRRPGPPPAYFSPRDRLLQAGELDRVLPEADALVLALPRDPSTDRILDRRRLALLPPHAVIVNVGRGNAIDEEALVEALERGRLRAALLDVFQQEPLPEDSPLRRAPGVTILPHASAIAPDYLDLFVEELIAPLRRLQAECGRGRTR